MASYIAFRSFLEWHTTNCHSHHRATVAHSHWDMKQGCLQCLRSALPHGDTTLAQGLFTSWRLRSTTAGLHSTSTLAHQRCVNFLFQALFSCFARNAPRVLFLKAMGSFLLAGDDGYWSSEQPLWAGVAIPNVTADSSLRTDRQRHLASNALYPFFFFCSGEHIFWPLGVGFLL